jgi:uncharacterized OB-fold protein
VADDAIVVHCNAGLFSEEHLLTGVKQSGYIENMNNQTSVGTVLAPAPAPFLKSLPVITDFNRPFFDALRNRQFVVPKCQDCGDYHWTPYPACRSCLSMNLAWTPVSGDATLYTFTVVQRAGGPYSADVPYVIAMGELVERPRSCLILATLVGTAPENLTIGQPMRIAYQDVPSEDATVFHWMASPAS